MLIFGSIVLSSC